MTATLHTPLRWGDTSVSTFEVEMTDPVLHIVKAVLPFVGALTTQLAGQPLGTAEVDFVPFLYDISISMHNYHGMFMTNRYNVFVPPSTALSEQQPSLPPAQREWNNSHLDLNGKALDLSWSLDYRQFQTEMATTTCVDHCCIYATA